MSRSNSSHAPAFFFRDVARLKLGEAQNPELNDLAELCLMANYLAWEFGFLILPLWVVFFFACVCVYV